MANSCPCCGRSDGGHPKYCRNYVEPINPMWLNSHEFYELMQAYRMAPLVPQTQVTAAYNAVKQYIRSHIQT